jgi:predicted RNA-binding Zn-ribbon protein involved in translation (DUF1610 family)
MSTSTTLHLALHLLHGWWIASCPNCGYEFAQRRDQEAAERAGARRRCPICGPDAQVDGDPGGDLEVLHPPPRPIPAAAAPSTTDQGPGCRR